MEAFAIVVEERVFAILDDGALDLLDGLVALRNLHAVADPAHVDLGGRRALAGMEALGGQNDVELAVDIENIALADRAGDNLHRCYSLLAFGDEPRDFGPHHTEPGRVRQPFFAASKRSNGRSLALVGPRQLRRPAAVSAGARPHPVGAAGLVPQARLPGGRDPGAAGVPGQRGPSARLRDRADHARRQPRADVPAHLAGIHLQEAPGRGRSRGSSACRMCSATASAGRCTIPNSPCWSGIGPTSPTRR